MAPTLEPNVRVLMITLLRDPSSQFIEETDRHSDSESITILLDLAVELEEMRPGSVR